jgi:acetyl esterase
MSQYLDPTNQAFVDAGAKAGGPALYELGYTGARNLLEALQEHQAAKDVTTEEIKVDTKWSSTGSVTAVIYKPAGAAGDLPAFFFTHGGGWILGRLAFHSKS